MESEESSYFSDSFILTDDELSSISLMNINKIDLLIREKKKSKHYHKFFIYSIFSVKKASSQYKLLLYLQNRLTYGSYYIPIHDAEVIFRILFKDLPNHDNFRTNSENMELLFQCMSHFMIIFYRTLYPFFFDIDNDESLFSYNTKFIIDFLINFGSCLRQDIKTGSDFLDLIQSDGSITNILDYLFEFFINGIEYSRISNFFYTLFSLINPDFILDYIDQKNLLIKSPAVYINHRKKIILLTYYQIPFFMNYIKNKYDIISDGLNFKLNRTFSEDDKKKFNQTISHLHIYEYLESFLFNYTEQLISEGRLINESNPFKCDQIGIQTKSYKFYPEKANDFYSEIVFEFIFFLSNIMVETNMQETLLYFYPIISFSFKISYFENTYQDHALNCLFDYLKRSNSNKFDELKNILIETIKNRLIGNFKYDYEFLKRYNDKEFKDKVDQLNYFNYNTTYYPITLLNDIIDDCDEIINLLHSDDIEIIQKIFNVFYYASSTNTFYISLLEHYNDYITKPEISIIAIKILLSLNPNDYEYLIDQIKELTKLILKEQNITDNIDQKEILLLYKNLHDESSFSDIFEEEEEEEKNDIFNKIIENCDVLRIKIFSELLNREELTKYLHRASQHFIEKLLNTEIEKSNENVVQCIILLSGYLVCFQFRNEQFFKNIKYCISYLDNKKEECQIINGQMIELKSSNDHAKLNFIYILTNSYGFLLYEDYLNIISNFLEKYGMCIELLNIISNIIKYLVPYIDEQSISNECLLKTNENIFKIVQILIDNSLENNDDNKSQEDKEKRTYGFRKKTFSLSKTTVLHFSLLKNNKKSNYYYSYNMSGVKVDEKFGYEVKNGYLRIKNKDNFDLIANEFIDNVSNYANAMITKFGDAINFFDLFKKIIDFASKFKNK